MSALIIQKIPAACLRAITTSVAPAEITTSKIQNLIADMITTMKAAQGVGLAAPQIGSSKKIIIARRGTKPLVYFNPILSDFSFVQIDSEEGCLSIPETVGVVKRYRSLKLNALDSQGREVQERVHGFDAIILQHEVDHLNGILFTDRVFRYLAPGRHSNAI